MSVENLKFQMTTSINNVEVYKKNIKDIEEAIKQLDESSIELFEVKSILNLLKNYKMESKKDFILNTINSALKDVFDQNVRIDIEATTIESSGKLNMRYDIVLYQNDIEMARNEKLLGNNGGGVLSFISILFKILVGYIYSDNKFYLFDESISQVSPLYRPRLAKFLREFCETYSFTLVLISQTDDIDDYAHLGYLLDGEFDDENVPKLKIDRILGTYPDDKYFYSKIENFQSIVKQEFRYRGFTVIRGNNNIGKSASFRAVNALLFNTFDVSDHPRKKRPRGAETKILFGFHDSEAPDTDNRKIGLVYKSNKVVYEFNNMTFTGKNLAFEKVKEKVESIGFKYVDLAETYKNFKGNLKDQTERLALTTQYDGFYLVGNKTSETEKVFNFLFDSTEIANAIANVSQDINTLSRSIQAQQEILVQNKRLLGIEEKRSELLILQYYLACIEEYRYNLYNVSNLKRIFQMKNDIIEQISKYQMLVSGISELSSKNSILHSLKNSNVTQRLALLDEIIIFGQWVHYIDKFKRYTEILEESESHKKLKEEEISRIDSILLLKTEIEQYSYYKNNISRFIDNNSFVSTLYNQKNIIATKIGIIQIIIESMDKLNILNANITMTENNFIHLSFLHNKEEEIRAKLLLLNDEYKLCECPHCAGSGIITI